MSRPRARPSLPRRLRWFVQAIEREDEVMIEQVLRLSRSRRLFAPFASVVGALAMLFYGLRMLFANWRLLLVQIIPAIWLWLVLYDLRLHLLQGRSLQTLRGPLLIPLGLLIVAVTIACFFLNAVFAFAIADSPTPRIRPAFTAARRHLAPILVSGAAVGVLLALSMTLGALAGRPWFSLGLGIVVAVMMVGYVALPARLIGVERTQSRRDRLAASALSSALGVAVCTPPYVLGRVGLLLLGSSLLLAIPGFVILTVGVTLQAGAVGAVRAIKMSSLLAIHSARKPAG